MCEEYKYRNGNGMQIMDLYIELHGAKNILDGYNMRLERNEISYMEIIKKLRSLLEPQQVPMKPQK